MPYFENLIVSTFFKSFFTFCRFLSFFRKRFYSLYVSSIFWKGFLHSAIIFNLLKGSLHSAIICNLLERLFTLCQYLQSSGKVLCTLPVSSIFWKAFYVLLYFIYLSMYLHIFISGNFTLKNLCRIVALFYWKSERYSLKKVTGKYRNLPKFTGHYHKLPENRNEKIFFCRIVALIFNKWIPELWDIKCNTDSYFLPLAEPKCIFLCKIKKP